MTTSYLCGALCALIATRIDAMRADTTWGLVRFWLIAGLVAALVVRCGDPIPAM